MLTDGQVHDVPSGDAAAAAQELGAPLHALLSGRPDEADRRLQQVKTAYDPKNFFRMNQNIPPRL